jgi:hypothetical protein
VEEYDTARVKLIWVVNPETKTVRVHRADGTVTVLREKDELDGENVVPGFRCRVGDLFLPAAAAAAAPDKDRGQEARLADPLSKPLAAHRDALCIAGRPANLMLEMHYG